MSPLFRFSLPCCHLLLATLLVVPIMAQAGSGQIQAAMSVRAGCPTTTPSSEEAGLGYLCSPSVEDFRLSMDQGRNSDGMQRYLSDGHALMPYQLEILVAQNEPRRADDVLSIRLPMSAQTLLLQTIATPVVPNTMSTSGSHGSDTVLATFEY